MTIEYQLLRYYIKLDKDFHLLYTGFQREKGGKNLHALRVNIKKQLAFLKLLAVLNGEKRLKNTGNPLRKCRKLTSTIRDLEVEKTLVITLEHEMQIKPGFSSWLKKKERQEKRILYREEKNFSLIPVKEESIEIIQALPKLQGKENLWSLIGNYFLQKLDQINEDVEKFLNEGNIKSLHDLRKDVKELMLNIKVLHWLAPKGKKLSEIEAYLDLLQELLGEWHDIANAYALSRKYKNKAKRKLRKSLKLRKFQYQVNIATQLDSFVSFHKNATSFFRRLFSLPYVVTAGELPIQHADTATANQSSAAN